MTTYTVPKETLGGTAYSYNTTPAAAAPSNLNSYQQAQLAKLQQMQNTAPSSLSSNNSIFDPSQYANEQDWMGSDLLYKSYAQDAADGDPNAQAAMAARAAQLDSIYKSGNAQQGMINANYNQQVQQAQNGYNYSLSHPDGGDSFIDNFMATVVPTVVGAFMGAGAIGALSGAGATGAGITAASSAPASAAADVPFSALPTGVSSLPSLSSIAGGATGTADAAAGAAALGGSGALAAGASSAGAGAAASSIPQVVINGGLGAGGSAAISPGLGTAGALIGAGSLGSLMGGPSSLPSLDNVSGVQVPDSSLPPLVMPGMGSDPSVPNSDITPPEGTSLGGLPGIGGTGGTTPGLPSTGAPSVGNLLGGLGTLASAYTGYQMNQADKDYYQGILNKINGMYAPGTPEANYMQSQMDAKDAAAGRNSQYGVRSEELNAQLAMQRGNLMTSNGYVTMAQDARGHYDQSLNNMYGALGAASNSSSNLGSMLNTGSSLANAGTSLYNAGTSAYNSISNGVSNAGSYLSNLFSGGS